jgi:hypothetical protein
MNFFTNNNEKHSSHGSTTASGNISTSREIRKKEDITSFSNEHSSITLSRSMDLDEYRMESEVIDMFY